MKEYLVGIPILSIIVAITFYTMKWIGAENWMSLVGWFCALGGGLMIMILFISFSASIGRNVLEWFK